MTVPTSHTQGWYTEFRVPWLLTSCGTPGSNFRSCLFLVRRGLGCLLLGLPITLSIPVPLGRLPLEIPLTHSMWVCQSWNREGGLPHLRSGLVTQSTPLHGAHLLSEGEAPLWTNPNQHFPWD